MSGHSRHLINQVASATLATLTFGLAGDMSPMFGLNPSKSTGLERNLR